MHRKLCRTGANLHEKNRKESSEPNPGPARYAHCIARRPGEIAEETPITEEQNPADDAGRKGADMQPAVPIEEGREECREEGSPAKKPCSHIGLRGTADEQSAATNINSPAGARTPISAGPVPLSLVPQTISTEIHAHGGDISEIAVKRTGHHFYAISLTKTTPRGQKTGGADAD
ncbi:hypothetical protein [Methanogenium sp. MK-MG]|uniref:hypothetical protein n=1 Tax=Methanogenium sp. MK-MG TaxID=2599926 RepID=UPI0013EC659C|nr:hypothetical protein [Methanogenium sp. MK-MG]